MVFGSTYCGISRLEIKDGDTCIALPLKFSLGGAFDYYNKASVNSFLYVYEFCDKPVEVVYEGNPSELSILCPKQNKSVNYFNDTHWGNYSYELVMLVRKDVFNAIIIDSNCMEKYKGLTGTWCHFKTAEPIFNKWEKLADEDRELLFAKHRKTPFEDIAEEIKKSETPEWIRQVIGFAEYIDRLGMIPYPNMCVDQHDKGSDFWKIIDTIRNKNN